MSIDKKQIKSNVNLVVNCGQKKRKFSGKQLKPMATITDQMVEQFVSNLPLSQRLKLRSVSQQFMRSVDQSLAKEESIQFVGTYGKDLDVLINVSQRNQIDLNKIGDNFTDNNHNLVVLLSKFKQLKRLEFNNNIRIDNKMVDWLFNQFPNLSSLSLVDYRCNYRTFDWMSIGDRLSDSLTSLEIECRLNQQIYVPVLSRLVAKLYRLKELTLIGPRKPLNQLLSALGPNLVSLRITYCIGLTVDEIQALIDGNGKHLQELDIHYQSFGRQTDQNEELGLICENLMDLKYLSFNHNTLTVESLEKISNLKSLLKFQYKYSGVQQFRSINRYDYRFLDCKRLSVVFESLESLTLTNIELQPQIMSNWKKLFPNLKDLRLKSVFMCGCGHTSEPNNCYNCLRICFNYLSELKCLKSIDFMDASDKSNYLLFGQLQQITRFQLNCERVIERPQFLLILNSFYSMANRRPLFVRLYNIRGSLSRSVKSVDVFPQKLKITFEFIP